MQLFLATLTNLAYCIIFNQSSSNLQGLFYENQNHTVLPGITNIITAKVYKSYDILIPIDSIEVMTEYKIKAYSLSSNFDVVIKRKKS